MDEMVCAMAGLVQWLTEGKLQWRGDIQEGFKNVPSKFLQLFNANYKGKPLF